MITNKLDIDKAILEIKPKQIIDVYKNGTKIGTIYKSMIRSTSKLAHIHSNSIVAIFCLDKEFVLKIYMKNKVEDIIFDGIEVR